MRYRKLIAWLVVAVIAGGAFMYVRRWQRHRDARAVKFETVKLDRGPIIAKVTASGTLSARVTVLVGSQVSGRISEIFADWNSDVKKGQVIARLDPQLLTAALQQTKANHAAAQADLMRTKVQAQDADRQLARQKALVAQKLVAQADFDTAQANADAMHAQILSSKASVEQTRAALHQAEVNLEYATIKSPIDGTVISRSVELGQTVAASLQTPTLFTIAEDLRTMQVDTSVAEADVGKLQDGMSAAFTVDAYPTERFEGTVRQIRNAATNVQNVITYDAVIDVMNPQKKLRPGMTANVTFVHASRTNALRVTNAALRFKPSPELLGQRGGGQRAPAANGGSTPAARGPLTSTQRHTQVGDPPPDRRTIWVLRHNRPVSVIVRTGITDGTHTEILEGDVEEGDEIITDVASTGTSSASAQPAGRTSRRFGRIL
jgi:HlyD family secretion protein